MRKPKAQPVTITRLGIDALIPFARRDALPQRRTARGRRRETDQGAQPDQLTSCADPEEVGAVNAHYRAAMVHYVLHARPIAEIDQVIAEHPDLAEANVRLDQLYVWEEQ
jgi:hypothetical protein